MIKKAGEIFWQYFDSKALLYLIFDDRRLYDLELNLNLFVGILKHLRI